MKLTALDLLIIGAPIALMIWLTLYLRRYMTGVSDFLAAGRGAGRYLIATSSGEVAAGVLGLVAAMEVFSRAGFSLQLWGGFTGVLYLFIVISGYFSYRLRETRVLTLHQFLEVRYSRRLRIFAGMLTFFSGAFFFGVVPGVSARFFVNFLNLPAELPLLGFAVRTDALFMVGLLGLALFFTVTSGQIGVLVTDSLEFIVSLVMYLVVAVAILGLFSTPLVRLEQMETALLSGPPGGSYINPLDIGSRDDFNYLFVVIGFLLMAYNFRGSANSSSAASAHEGRMAGILGTWRGVGTGAMGALLAVCAFTLLNHSDFAARQAAVEQTVSALPSAQLQTQMRMPAALGELLPDGVRGCFVVIGLLGTIAGIGAYCMQMGTTFIQDVVLPIRGKPLDARRQVRWLRLSVAGFGLFTVVFSLLYKPADYLQMLMLLIGAIYLGGAGAVFIGGLYWSRGTTRGAWAALIAGAVLALSGWGLQTFWPALAPGLASLLGAGELGEWVQAHAARWPLNGQVMSLVTSLCAIATYVVVSLATCRQPHDMDKLLHRGVHAVKEDQEAMKPAASRGPRSRLARFLQIDEHFTRGDRCLAYLVFLYSLGWNLAFIGAVLWNVFIARWPDHWWWNYVLVQNIALPLVICVINTVWYSGGAFRDLVRLRRKLIEVRADDDGQVRASAPVSAAAANPGREKAPALR